ncbi:MAG: acetyl-CoA carboxylase biotin carboxylase subunit, partial [Bacteroidota bacterium]|nr:acetyl-CoA carboxylase biotin carboxylase subunit [Bacteroidota bacterium]
PITELSTGLDLVREQLRIASGEELSFRQEDIHFKGHTIECRICAEDPENNFMPSSGKITFMNKFLGNGIREDTGIEQGDEISIYYDPMISKLISHGADRNMALEKMKRALSEYKIEGIKTNISFLLELIDSAEFRNGEYHTQFIETEFLNRPVEDFTDPDTTAALSIAGILFRENKKPGQPLNGRAGSHNGSKWVNKRSENYR